MSRPSSPVRPSHRLVLLALLTVLTACRLTDSSDADRPLPYDPISDQFIPGAVNIGSSVSNASRRNAMLLGVKHVNDAGGVLGRTYNMVALFSPETSEGVRHVSAMIAAGIPVVSSSGSQRTVAVAPLTITSNTLLISESATSPVITSLADNDLVFRMAPSDIHQGRVLAELARADGRQRAMAVYNQGDPFGVALAQVFRERFEAAGGSYLGSVEIPGSVKSGFDSYLKQLFDPQPDVILNTMRVAAEAATFVNESEPYGYTGGYLFSDTIAGSSSFTLNIANALPLDGALGTSGGVGLSSDLAYQYFSTAYRQQFGLDSGPFDANAYDYALVTALAIEHAGRLLDGNLPNGVQIRDSLRSVMNAPGLKVGPTQLATALQYVRDGVDIDYDGAYGDTDWDANGDVIGEVVYNIFSLDAASRSWRLKRQLSLTLP